METSISSCGSRFNIETRLLFELEKFKHTLGPRGNHIRTHGPGSLRKLRALPEHRQAEILASFQGYADLISSVVSSHPDSLNNEADLFRGVAQKFRLVVDEDLYRILREEKDTLVEVYNQDFVQIYRSTRFMEMCNYTLLDLLTYEFYELFERSASLTDHLFRFADILKRRGTLEGIDLSVDIPKHLMREKFSEERGVFQIEFMRMYPTYTWPKEFHGFALVSRGTPYYDQATTDTIAFI